MQRIVLIAMGLLVTAWAFPVVAQEEATDIAKLEAKVKQLQTEIRDRSRVIDEGNRMLVEFGGVNAVREQASELRQRQNELDFEGIVMAARRQAMEKQIARLAQRVEKALAEDKLLAIMRAAMAEQEQRHKQLVEKGLLPAAEARTASLSEHIRLAERENEVAKQAGQEIINRLNGELVDMEIREAELVARERHMQMLREQGRQNLDVALRVLQHEAELNRATREQIAAESHLRRLKN